MRIHPTRRAVLGAAALIAAPPAAFAQSGLSTLVGTGVEGSARDGDLAGQAKINNPFGVLIGPDGYFYWADFGSHRILRLDLKTMRIGVVAGTGVNGHAGDGGPARAAQLSTPHEVRFDSKGNMVIAERDAHVIRHIDMKTGIISTLAGTGVAGFGGDGGPAAVAQLRQPHSIALDKNDNLYICDILNNRVRKRDPATGIITTFAGNGEAADTPDEAKLAGTPLRGPRSIDIGPDGTLYLILREGNKAYAIDPAGQTLKRIAGTGAKGYAGDSGAALAATFNGPKGIAWAPDNSLYISDTENHVIRRLDLKTGLIATVIGTGVRGDGPEADPRKCALARPHGVYVHAGTLFFGDSENHRIRMLKV